MEKCNLLRKIKFFFCLFVSFSKVTIVLAFVYLFCRTKRRCLIKARTLTNTSSLCGKADAAHYQCPSLTTISYHPCWIIPSVSPALRELRVFDRRRESFVYLSRLPVSKSLVEISFRMCVFFLQELLINSED